MTPARALTPEGVRRGREFLRAVQADLNADPNRDISPPEDILFGSECSREIDEAPMVEHRAFTKRREAAEYLEALSPPLDQQAVDDWPFWSWLGLWHVADVLHTKDRRERMSSEEETFVVDWTDARSRQNRYRNYLWTSWRLYEAFGEEVAFLLDRDITEIGQVTRRIINSPRIFNSVGVPQLILRLYTREAHAKRGIRNRPGGLNHLLRILPQLELTHDVYGMSPDALLGILPPEVREWDER